MYHEAVLTLFSQRLCCPVPRADVVVGFDPGSCCAPEPWPRCCVKPRVLCPVEAGRWPRAVDPHAWTSEIPGLAEPVCQREAGSLPVPPCCGTDAGPCWDGRARRELHLPQRCGQREEGARGEGASPARSRRGLQPGSASSELWELSRLCLCRYFRIKSSVG